MRGGLWRRLAPNVQPVQKPLVNAGSLSSSFCITLVAFWEQFTCITLVLVGRRCMKQRYKEGSRGEG